MQAVTWRCFQLQGEEVAWLLPSYTLSCRRADPSVLQRQPSSAHSRCLRSVTGWQLPGALLRPDRGLPLAPPGSTETAHTHTQTSSSSPSRQRAWCVGSTAVNRERSWRQAKG
jgi:hypothetical protein